MPKKKEVLIPVSVSLLRLLMAEPEDFKDDKKDSYEDVRATAKAMANLLIAANE